MCSSAEHLRRSIRLVVRLHQRLLLLGGDGYGDGRQYSSSRSTPRMKLLSCIIPLGHPSVSLAPELERWAKNQKKIFAGELQDLVKDLRSRNRQKQALEVSEWMKSKEICGFTPGDDAIQLDLIGQVRGLGSAKSYFHSLADEHKTLKTYGALLNCYVREGLVEESLQLMKTMKALGFVSTALPYNNIMCLYANSGQFEKIPLVLSEMKNHGILPDNFSYRLCINSYGARSLVAEMEETLEEMNCQPQIVVDWNTYAVVSHIYIKAGLPEKASAAAKKSEERMNRKNHLCYNHLISLHGGMKNKSEMWRLWHLQEQAGVKHLNRDYTIMLGELVKLGEFNEAEDLLRRWEVSGNSADFRVADVVLSGLCKSGQVEKAEEMLRELERGAKAKPQPSSWGILARAFAEKGETMKAHLYLEKALRGGEPEGGWKPSPSVILRVLHWLRDDHHAGPKLLGDFAKLLKPFMAADRIEEDESTRVIRGLLNTL